MQIIPDDNPSSTTVFTLRDIKNALAKNDSVDEEAAAKVVELLEGNQSVAVAGGQVLIVPVGTGLFEVYVREAE